MRVKNTCSLVKYMFVDSSSFSFNNWVKQNKTSHLSQATVHCDHREQRKFNEVALWGLLLTQAKYSRMWEAQVCFLGDVKALFLKILYAHCMFCPIQMADIRLADVQDGDSLWHTDCQCICMCVRPFSHHGNLVSHNNTVTGWNNTSAHTHTHTHILDRTSVPPPVPSWLFVTEGQSPVLCG